MSQIKNKISTIDFYTEYHGHKIVHLKLVLNSLKSIYPSRNFIYLAGDSSLDNKFWLSDHSKQAINGYQYVLNPTLMKPDIAYHLNALLIDSNYCAINAAIEESTIASRNNDLLPQDKFIQENITDDDILIVSVGGNDIALSPTLNTIWNMVVMMYMNNIETIAKGPNATWGMSYFINMFKDGVKNYILKLIGNKRPKKIIVCMIYYPDERVSGSWADKVLKTLGYDTNPQKLQMAIQQIFKHATSKINIDGSEVISFPMYKILDGKTTKDYIDRVEPSSIGGSKLAKAFINHCL